MISVPDRAQRRGISISVASTWTHRHTQTLCLPLSFALVQTCKVNTGKRGNGFSKKPFVLQLIECIVLYCTCISLCGPSSRCMWGNVEALFSRFDLQYVPACQCWSAARHVSFPQICTINNIWINTNYPLGEWKARAPEERVNCLLSYLEN